MKAVEADPSQSWVKPPRPIDSSIAFTAPRPENMIRINMPTTAAERMVGR
jgi:hypothetical protein